MEAGGTAQFTVELVTNVLAGMSKAGILKAYGEAVEKVKHAAVPPLWDGKASDRMESENIYHLDISIKLHYIGAVTIRG